MNNTTSLTNLEVQLYALISKMYNVQNMSREYLESILWGKLSHSYNINEICYSLDRLGCVMLAG